MELTTANTAIVVDSTADLTEALERFPNWRMVPLYVRFGAESFKDYVEMPPGEFYARLRTASELPTTSQPTPGDFLAAYEALSEYERIYSLHLAGSLSGTVESARAAALELGDGRVRIVDTGVASAAIAMLGLAMQRRLERGSTDDELEQLAGRYGREAGLLFTVDTLEYLARGGRIGRARALAGNLLNVKPILTIAGGEVVPLGRERGSRKALAALVRELRQRTEDGPGLRVGVAHADAQERAETLLGLVLEARPQAVIEVRTSLGAVIGTHAGPGTVGFFWFVDED